MDHYVTVKVPLKHVLRDHNVNIPKITAAVINCNKIVINTLMFMKLYLLNYFEINKSLPLIDKQFINSCMKIQCNNDTKNGKLNDAKS